MVHVHPNSRNVIPGRVKFSIDLRNNTDAGVDAMADEIRSVAQSLQASTGLSIELSLVSSFSATAFHDECISAISDATVKLGYSHMPVVSGAGHDAIYAARWAPSGMIFIPCKDGISHNEIEDAKPADIEAGCNVLLHAMLAKAKVVLPP